MRRYNPPKASLDFQHTTLCYNPENKTFGSVFLLLQILSEKKIFLYWWIFSPPLNPQPEDPDRYLFSQYLTGGENLEGQN
jgi:hypothetical protein